MSVAVIALLLVVLIPFYTFSENAPEFRASHLDGSTFRSTELSGKTVLLDFWAVWCPPCIQAIPKLNRLQKDFGSKGFKVLGVAVYSGSSTDVRRFIEEHKIEYPVVLGDEDALEAFEVIGYPTYYLMTPDGKIRKQYVGEIPNLYDLVVGELKVMEQEKKP